MVGIILLSHGSHVALETSLSRKFILQLPFPCHKTTKDTFQKDALRNTAMLTSGFKYAPVSQLLVVWVVAASIAASITDTKYYFYLQAVPHIWKWRQFWRLFTWQVCRRY
jgi:hypothetical protein